MAYPGDPTLDQKVQQRIMTAFGEAARLHREGHPEEARTILRSILEVDPKFVPGQRLDTAIVKGEPVDLGELLGEVTASAPFDASTAVAKIRQAVAQRDYPGALTLAQAVLRELPGHAEARQLAQEAQSRLRASSDVQAHLARAREALNAGKVDEARSFLNLARNLDPANPVLPELVQRVEIAAKPVSPNMEFEFEVFDHVPGGDAPSVEAGPTFTPPAAPSARPAAPPARPTPPAPAPPPSMAAGPPSVGAAPSFAPTGATPGGPPAPAASPAFGASASVPATGEGGFEFDMPGAPSFAFEAGQSDAAVAERAGPAARVQSLLDQGQSAFDRGDYHVAIDTWSRIFLIDSRHEEAEHRIDQARRRQEEGERAAEHRFYEAREAAENGRVAEARRLCQEVLELQPQHLEAHDLLQRLDTPTAPPPPPPPSESRAADEDDLFRDDFVPARISPSGATLAVRDEEVARPARRERPASERARGSKGLPLPLPLMVIIGGLVVVLGIAGFMLRGKVFSGAGSAVADGLWESEKLAQQGRLQEAITLLQSLQGQAEGDPANQLNQRILEYQRQLKAKSGPARVVDTAPIWQAISAGERLKATRLVNEGLTKAPTDPELLRMQVALQVYSPLLPVLATAVTSRKWDSIRQLCGQVLAEHPEDTVVRQLWASASYNLAVVLLRQYKVVEANAILDELLKQGPDDEAKRLKDFATSYVSRPTDPRYQMFVTSVPLRPVD
jgi:tetratricopeptide (TPR) repeat protein